MTVDRMEISLQTAKDNIAIMESVEEPDDAGYYLQLEHEKFVAEAIEKQIPKKPIGRDLWELATAKGHSCPACGYDIPYTKYPKHCEECGQALDWSDTG